MQASITRATILLSCVMPVITASSGCAGIGTSKWAMDDPNYAEKYDKPYSGNDAEKATRMFKQSVDVRYVKNQGGYYFGAATADDPFALGAEVGAFHYFGSMVEGRAGLKGLLGTAEKDWFVGGDFGFRMQTPTRLAPFVGVGTFLGGNQKQVNAENDHLDNDDDTSVDERGETSSEYDFLASVYPEVGMHFWLNSSTRLTAGAQYHMTPQGRADDFWFFGFSVAVLQH